MTDIKSTPKCLRNVGVLKLARFSGCALLFLVTTGMIISEFDAAAQLFDLASQLTPLYLIAATLSSLSFFYCGNRQLLIVSCALLLINAWTIFSLYVPAPQLVNTNNRITLRLLELNTNAKLNKNYGDFTKLVQSERPDVIFVIELTPDWIIQADARLSDYPYRFAEKSNGGIAIYSRFPLKNTKLMRTVGVIRPRICANLQLADHFVYLELAHAATPHQGRFDLRNSEFHEIAQEMHTMQGASVLVGDLNCTPWSGRFKRLLLDSNLVDSETGFGLQPTWCSKPWGLFFPIDHVLTKGGIVVTKRKVCSEVDSDHLPLAVELSVP